MIYTNYGMQQVRLMAWISFSEVNPQNEAPLTFDFPEPYPNPFNEQINIVFTLQKNEKVALSIWNTLGEEVAVLEAGPLNKGLHSYIWRTEGITSGIYFIQLKTSEGRMIRKIVLMK
jgi:hypothetical protein